MKWVTETEPANRSRVLVAVQDYWDEDDIYLSKRGGQKKMIVKKYRKKPVEDAKP